MAGGLAGRSPPGLARGAAAVVAAMATAGFADSLDERAKRAAVCPNCRSELAEQTR